MRYATCIISGKRRVVITTPQGRTLIPSLNQNSDFPFGLDLDDLIQSEQIGQLPPYLASDLKVNFDPGSSGPLEFAAPFLKPPKIWGIGLNFREHAADLQAPLPTEPASFMKPRTTIIGPGAPIRLPGQSQRVTGEAELGVIIGKRCKNLALADVRQVILGFTTVLDLTAEDILQRNPRFLTRAKSFDTFFSFGPWIVTPDEISDLAPLEITTYLNGQAQRRNLVANMIFSPEYLVAFHSAGMTLEPGDIIACGTPGAVKLTPGDRLGAEVSQLGYLENPVIADTF